MVGDDENHHHHYCHHPIPLPPPPPTNTNPFVKQPPSLSPSHIFYNQFPRNMLQLILLGSPSEEARILLPISILSLSYSTVHSRPPCALYPPSFCRSLWGPPIIFLAQVIPPLPPPTLPIYTPPLTVLIICPSSKSVTVYDIYPVPCTCLDPPLAPT